MADHDLAAVRIGLRQQPRAVAIERDRIGLAQVQQPDVASDGQVNELRARALGEQLPGHDVAVVLHLGEQNPVAGFEELRSPGGGDKVDAFGRAAVENDLVGAAGVDEFRGAGAGGLEGGITNGEDVLVTLYQKPISTLRDGLPSVDIETKEPHRAQYERSDVTAVPACGVIGEAMLAFVLADALLEKTGGDSMEEVTRNFEGFVRAQRLY